MVKYHPRNKPVHGFQERNHPCYNQWSLMRRRCHDPKDKNYHNYGGRGIVVCTEWRMSFESFAIDMGLPPTPKHTLDRRDNEKGYNKDNCRWATRTEQCLNRRIFSNNTTGVTGIVKLENGTYSARYDENKHRYRLGNFETIENAAAYRNKFLELFAKDKEEALKMTERRINMNSSTGIRGVTKTQDGYMVRVTLSTGERKYLGFSKTLSGAIEKLEAFNGVCDE